MLFSHSLRFRFVIPLLLGGLLVALFGSAFIYTSSQDEANRMLIGEGLAIASALKHSSMVAHNDSEVQHVVEEVHKDNEQLSLTLIVRGHPARVIASSRPEWVGLPVTQLPAPEFIHELGSSGDEAEPNDNHQTDHSHNAHNYPWNGIEYGKVRIPLGSHLSSHTHQHSSKVTDHLGAKSASMPHASRQVSSAPAQTEQIHDDSHSHTEVVSNPAPAPIAMAENNDSSGHILLLLDRSRVDQITIANTLRIIASFSIAIALTMMLAVLLMSTQVLAPLAAINQTMRQREAGDKNTRAPILGQDELANVAITLNGMLETLGKNEHDLLQLTQAVEQSSVSIVITNIDGVIEYVNPYFCKNTGYSRDELIGQTPARISSGLTPNETYDKLWKTISAGGQWQGELQNRSKNGDLHWENVIVSPIVDDQGTITQYLGIKEDITVRKAYEAKLLRQANFDELTGLPNRILAQDRLTQAIASAHRSGKNTKAALLFIDLDDFKKVNDTLGHEAGDQLLTEVSSRFRGCVRETDTVARFGGDEFIVIVPDVHAQEDVELVAENLLNQLVEPFVLDDINFFINASIGIALYPDDGDTAQHLLQDADAAMYRSKQDSRSQFCFYTAAMNEEAIDNLRLEEALRHALELNQLEVHFQPVIDCNNGDIVGAEALMRWNHPQWGMIPPFKFIPLAERTNLILPIGEWILNESCRIAAGWTKAKAGNFRIAINLSAKQFGGRRILDEVRQALKASGLPPQNLELEFTESVLMREDEETMSVINELHQMGIRFAIDDFGTGYSSISYLRQYPFDTLKIDRSFVQDVTNNKDDANLVNSIVALANSLELEVLAEGIEEWSQFDFLRNVGATRCQGWLFSKALPEQAFHDQMVAWQTFQGLKSGSPKPLPLEP